MQLILPTVPNLLRTRFIYTRQVLLGQPRAKWHRLLIPAKLTKVLLNIVSLMALMVAGVLFVPAVYYQFSPADIKPVETLQTGTPLGGEFAAGDEKSTATNDNQPEEQVLPPQNPDLPAGEWLIIPRTGVRTQLRSTQDPEEALKEGVWLVPDYGQPGDTQIPMILAAHRYGWQWWWQSDYWRYNSFYYLPELEPGDLVEIIANQRKWTYEIYAGEQGEEISDYEADLIMYTCKFLNSPVRHFRYARLVGLEQDTQG